MSASRSVRNVAIIAHVDHGKTTLVDQLFRQSGMFRDNQSVDERLMDSLDLERERGITILSKNGAFTHRDHTVNIIDTPGHADFGGQVERVLEMADGCLLLVDAAEGPMPQTFFVLRKALERRLPVIVVVNKVDKPLARPAACVDAVFDLFVRLEAPDALLDFPVIYASAKVGYAASDPAQRTGTMRPLMDLIVEKVPPPSGDPSAPFSMLVSTITDSAFFGRLAVGKIAAGRIRVNDAVALARPGGPVSKARATKLYAFHGSGRREVLSAEAGDVVAVSGLDDVRVGDTVADPDNPVARPAPSVDPPTLSMHFIPNDSPFSGREGIFVTSRHLRERLLRETLSDTALHVEEAESGIGMKVSGRGELHLSILIETMRREGFEFQVTRPEVLLHREGGDVFEPFEELTVDVEPAAAGQVIERLGRRRGVLLSQSPAGSLSRMRFRVPTRGLIGFRSEFLTLARGMGTVHALFAGYDRHAGEIRRRVNGALIALEACDTVAYALRNVEERGVLFLGPGERVYGGQVIGEHARETDLVVNPAKGKKLTNIRAAGSDEAVVLTPHRRMSLEDCIAWINEDEWIEATPKAIRLRKSLLDAHARKRAAKVAAAAA